MTLEPGDYVKVTYGKHRGKTVRVARSGRSKITFMDGVYNRYVSHGHYEIVNNTTSTDGTISADDSDSHDSTGTINDFDSYHIAGIANIVASKSNGASDVDRVLDEITRKIRNMAIRRIRSRSI